jgi:hypothetical protein
MLPVDLVHSYVAAIPPARVPAVVVVFSRCILGARLWVKTVSTNADSLTVDFELGNAFRILEEVDELVKRSASLVPMRHAH